MYFDQQIGKTETKRDAYSLKGLVAWLEKMPAACKYDYLDTDKCLAGQFCRSVGRGYHGQGLDPSGVDLTFDEKMERIAVEWPRTYGAALSRARAAL